MKREGQRRAEYFAALVEKVKEIPVAVVVGTVIQIYDRNRNPVQEKDLATLGSGNYLALCPFHADEKLGSFVVTPDKQMWYCFTENIGWSGIHFEMMYFELDFKDAVFHLARRCSLITEEEYKRQSGKKMDEKMVKTIEKSMEKPVSKPCVPKASSDVINTVYSIMPKVCGLRKEHEKQLLNARGLKKEDLGDYFTFPTRKMDLPKRIYRETGEMMAKRKFGKPLRELDETERAWMEKSRALATLAKELPSVPGFYTNEKENRIDFSSYKGIGFLVRDDAGRVQGIQIRRDVVKEGESRYVWFSSAFAEAAPGCSRGAPSGAPGGVIFPKEGREAAALCITEGRFKAEQIAKKGNIAVYISGVSTWRSVLPMIDRIKGERKKAYVMFDADMMGNTAVHSQLKEICESLQEHGLKPFLLLWPIAKGKGFDDLVLSQGSSYHRYMVDISYKRFEPLYDKAVQGVLDRYGAARVRDIKGSADRAAFNKDVQEAVETAVGL